MKAGSLSMVLVAGMLINGWAGDAYRFTLDGEKIDPWVIPVFGESGKPAAGDVVRVAGFPMVLGEPGEYAFREEDEDRLLGKLPGMDAEV